MIDISLIRILTTQITRVSKVANLYRLPLSCCRVSHQTVRCYSSSILVSHKSSINMKRSSTEGVTGGSNTKKQKQSSLLDSMGGGGNSSTSKVDLEGTWKGFGEAEKGLKPLLYFTPNIMKGLLLLRII